MLTQAQIRWAASHDWFVRDNRNGTITVLDRVYCGHIRGATETVIVWRDTFQALRDWAGY